MIIKEKLIILKTTQFGESDLVVHGLNPQGGKVILMAKAALKSKKRFGGGVLEPTHYIQSVYKRRSEEHFSSGMSMLSSATLYNSFCGLRTDYARLELSFYFLKTISKVSQEGDENSPEIFDILGNALRSAETSDQLPLLRIHFNIKLVRQQGLLPFEAEMEPFLRQPLVDHGEIKMSPEHLHKLASIGDVLFQ